jgi:multiple sugar transport system permease protein
MVTTTAQPAAPAAPPRRPPKRDVQGSGRLAALLLSPVFLVLAVVVGYPVLMAFQESLYQHKKGLDASGFVVEGDKFAGVSNYSDIFSGASSHAFWNAFWNTTFFTVVQVSIECVLGVCMALIMQRAFRGTGLIRASVLVPWAIPTAVSGIMWRWVFNAGGVANAMLGSKVLWTAGGFQSKLAVIIADTWKTAPFIGLLVLAGLQMIPSEVYEAARVDGANAWRAFWRITLPLVRPALMVAVLFRMLDTLRMFDLPYVLVGAHEDSVQTLTMVAFNEANNLHYGPAAAYATILFLYIAIIAYAFVRILGADVMGRGVGKERKA